MPTRAGSVPNTINTQPTGNLLASLIDTDFTTIYNVVNDSSNGFVNYVADTGAANAYVVTNTSPALAYRQGMVQVLQPAHTNTAGSTINVDGLGTQVIQTQAGANLSGGELQAGTGYILVYIGTTFRIFGQTSPAFASSLINGDMQVWQRGAGGSASFPSLGGGATYTADRWKFETNAGFTGRCTVSQQLAGITGTPNYPDTEYALRVTVTTAQASLAAGDYAWVCQRVEQIIARALYDNPTSISILLRSSSTGTFLVSLRNNNGGTPNQSYVAECVISAANTWQRFTLQAIPTMPTGTGTWGANDNDYSYILAIALAAGSSFQTTAGAWQNGNFAGDANQTNLFANNGATLDITLVQHQTGSLCTPFLYKSFSTQRVDCQAYYQNTYDYGTAPGTVTNNGSILFLQPNATTSTVYVQNTFPRELRTVPAYANFTFYSPTTGVLGSIRDASAPADRVVSSVPTIGKKGFSQIVCTTNFSAQAAVLYHYLVDVDF